MEIKHFNHPKLYYEKVKAYLLQEEAVLCMILGISNTLINSPDHLSSCFPLTARGGERKAGQGVTALLFTISIQNL